MQTLSTRILVEADLTQKDFDNGLQCAKDFQGNHRDRNPVTCTVLQGNALVKKGLTLLAHHNFFYEDSPFRVVGNTFSITTNENIFARLDEQGHPHSMFGNVMAERIPIDYFLEMPPEFQQMYRDRVRVIADGCGYRKGQVILVENYADYEVIYNFQGVERRVIKVKKEHIVGRLKNESV